MGACVARLVCRNLYVHIKYHSVFLKLYDYNYWATRRIVGAAANLTADQFTAPTPLSWGSVRDVLTHVLGAAKSAGEPDDTR